MNYLGEELGCCRWNSGETC